MKARHKKLAVIGSSVIGLTIAVLLVMNAFRDNLVFFYSPSDVYAGKAPVDRAFRLGGMVQEGSVKKSADGLKVDFVVTDFQQSLKAHYQGILPDLFREGQGVVAQGRLGGDNVFVADEVLAKHDENYMPPEVADALERAGGKPPASTKP